MPLEAPLPKVRTALVADLFCGAGGSSSGARRALARLGWQMSLVAVNHWAVAIDTHQRNHPEARHYCADVNAAKPAALVPEGKLDLLMASPTCTFHSRARGGKPINDQGRMDPWAVVHWCTELRVKRLLVENVPEFVDWAPIDLRTGRPIKRRRGEYFRAWVAALQGAGFRVEWRILNAADFGDATTRERFFLMARSDGRRIEWPNPTHSRAGDPDLLGHGAKRWRAAREIIDWTIPGRSIFGRKRPLSPKTLARIYAGAVKFRWPEPFLVILRNHMAGQSVDGPLPTITAGGTHIGLAEPFLCGNRTNNVAKDLDTPLGGPTTTTGGGFFMAEPFIAAVAHGNEPGERDPHSRRTRAIDEPLQTIHAGGGKFAVVEPCLVNMKGRSTAGSVDDPAPTITAHARHLAVAEPFVLGQHHDRSLRSVDHPAPTVTSVARIGLVEPFVLSQASGGAPRSVDDPVPTITTGGHGSAHALIAPYYGSGSGLTCGSAEAPLPTVTTRARFGLVIPLTHADGSNRARSTDDPLPTITTAARGELAFIAAAFGERLGQGPRVHSIEEPAPTICATGRVQLVEPAADGLRYDIRFRMLEPRELARAMGFSDDEVEYEFTGNKTQVTRQIGNAVPVGLATELVAALMRV